jgi:hypothetical protein
MHLKKIITVACFLVMSLAEASSQNLRWLVPYRSGNLWGLADTNARVIIKPQYEEVDFAFYNRIRFRKKGLWGYLDENGKEILPAKFKTASYFFSHINGVVRAVVSYPDGTSYYIGPHGEILQNNNQIVEGAALPDVEGVEYRTPDTKDLNQLFATQYDSIKPAYQGKGTEGYPVQYYTVFKNGKAGLVDKFGELLINPKYDGFITYSSKFIVAKEGSKYRIINEKDQPGYKSLLDSVIYIPSYRMIQIKEGGKWGILNFDLTTLIPSEYDEIFTSMSHPNMEIFNRSSSYGSFAWHHLYLLKQGNKWGAFFNHNKYLLKPVFNEIYRATAYHPGAGRYEPVYLNVRLENGKEGYVNQTGTKQFFK